MTLETIKLKNDKLIKMVLIVIFILNAQIFMLPLFSSVFKNINTYHNKLLITILSLLLFIYWLFVRYKAVEFDKSDLIILDLLLLMCILLFTQLISSGEKIQLLISNFYYNLILLLYFPLKSFFYNKKNLAWFIKMYVCIGIIYAVSTCVCFYFFQDYITQNNITLVQSVNSKIRFPQTSDLIGSTILFILIGMGTRLYSTKKAIIFLVICMYCLVEISNVRMITLISVILMLSYFYKIILLNEVAYKKILFHLIVIVITCITLLKTNFFEKFIGIGQQQASVFYRFEVIDYYKNHFFDNIIFGFGFSDRVKNIYNYTDIGLMGFLFRYGMAISVWIIGLMYYFMKNLNSNIVNKLIFIYFIGMSISLSLFDSQRIIYFPIIFSIFSSSIKRGEMYEL
ncbi:MULTISPECIES: hypothetical protein [Enterococcus]|uniref:hypothetical protein n=1 Tax=Enterococcus TaxID=1350 RepID=UPI00103A16DD|nr:hypothetical protein [Enterococcus faecium]MCO5419321.1 hypothetical protein [Enterococcus faecium]MCV3192364.1 hypothetical protein [Enterococcus faecium]HAQ0189312.1 hypothetical protein [Enterococcus faecium]HAQ4401196.1 hypothetical protein [Enterococcus faecium]HAR1646435.1 hypothetical protein [Enterococcus faecium]